VIVTLRAGADADTVRRELAALGLWTRRFEHDDAVCFLVEAHSSSVDARALGAIAGIESVATARSSHPLVDAQPRAVRVGRVIIGVGAPPVFMVGPCSVESEEQIRAAARRLAPLGAQFLRGGAFKPRTSPYEFQGRGAVALRWLRRAADDVGMHVVTEAMSAEDAPVVAEHADLVQVGSRNMHSYALLRAVGQTGRPVLLKRGMAATVEEWLNAAEYCLLHGAKSVVLCERGIRSFDPSTRNVLDLGAVALLAHVHRLPIVVDPSHGTGRRELVPALARAAMASGAAGLMLETHDSPGDALSDGPQALLPAQVATLLAELRPRATEVAAHA